ncbi:hypothetical protein J6590_105780 [Homalodisca vitripennis]|nr:hypothetical protein J6590_105780 [Homalodisca vitripennis]
MLWADNARHVQTRSTDNICSYCVSYIHWSLDVVKLYSSDKQNIIWRPCCHSACTMLWADNARHVQTSGDKQNIIWRPCCHSACTMLWADNARHVQTRSTDNICSYCVSYIHWSLDVVKLYSSDKQNIIWRPCCHSACTMLWADNARHVQTRSTDNICSYCVSYIHWSLDVVKL